MTTFAFAVICLCALLDERRCRARVQAQRDTWREVAKGERELRQAYGDRVDLLEQLIVRIRSDRTWRPGKPRDDAGPN